MAKLKKLKAEVESHPQFKTPRRIYDIQARVSRQEPRKIAEGVLRRIAGDLGVAEDLSQLEFDKVRKTPLGTQVLFQQYHQSRPISGAWVRVDLDDKGRVYNIQNDLVPTKVLERAARPAAKRSNETQAAELSQTDAARQALEATAASRGERHEVIEQEQCYFTQDGTPKLAWKSLVKSAAGRAGSWKVYVDAETGDILEMTDLLKHQEGLGRVFDPNPVVTLNNTQLENDSSIPDSAYVEARLPDLESTGNLDGPFVSTRRTLNRVQSDDGRFFFRRSHRAFKEVMVYFHIDRVQRYLKQLGFDEVLNRQIEVDADGIPDDNSFYDPLTKALTFGTGGVDDAEDADIILHEYGHAIQDDIIPGFGPGGEARAMGEGFGDYLAASFFSDVKPEPLRPCVGTWDAVAYSGDDPPCLRRVDSNKKYPRDMVGEEHADGEIWSACLWELRGALGRLAADRLVIAHHFQLSNKSASFEDAAKAMMTTDRVLNEGRNEALIREVFVRRGILSNPSRKDRHAGRSFGDTHGK